MPFDRDQGSSVSIQSAPRSDEVPDEAPPGASVLFGWPRPNNAADRLAVRGSARQAAIASSDSRTVRLPYGDAPSLLVLRRGRLLIERDGKPESQERERTGDGRPL